jgi:uncharacterized protein YhbP (UPF0306 family)
MEYEPLARKLIEEQHIMTLATAGERGPWAAPVYYVFLEPSFYFFSDPASRHIEDCLQSPLASAAVFAPVFSWQDIRGLQMSGAVEAVMPGLAALKAVGSYLVKFPFAKGFFNPSEPIDLNAFSNRFRVRLYRFKPALVYYLDNSIAFGFRQRVHFGP